ncbi:hypothetical protein RhiirA4_468674 [Rhizophagus irregularis]|uniref:Uncharacterized protein n=1 Tax=Rhizophagus irregularis TaxID=588596 RepID=A0A2I1GY44_9GLOM|nr:hypothetical protein RhiirA4_468674 [Rhizophagus irregularis]
MSEVIGLGMEYMVTIKRFDNKNLHKRYFQAANRVFISIRRMTMEPLKFSRGNTTETENEQARKARELKKENKDSSRRKLATKNPAPSTSTPPHHNTPSPPTNYINTTFTYVNEVYSHSQSRYEYDLNRQTIDLLKRQDVFIKRSTPLSDDETPNEQKRKRLK